MKVTRVYCDSCQNEILVGAHESIALGHAGCVMASADICTGCLRRVEKTLGFTLTDLHKRTKSEPPV